MENPLDRLPYGGENIYRLAATCYRPQSQVERGASASRRPINRHGISWLEKWKHAYEARSNARVEESSGVRNVRILLPVGRT